MKRFLQSMSSNSKNQKPILSTKQTMKLQAPHLCQPADPTPGPSPKREGSLVTDSASRVTRYDLSALRVTRHALRLFRHFAISQFHFVTPHSSLFTLHILCYSVTLLLCHSVTLSLCYFFKLTNCIIILLNLSPIG